MHLQMEKVKVRSAAGADGLTQSCAVVYYFGNHGWFLSFYPLSVVKRKWDVTHVI